MKKRSMILCLSMMMIFTACAKTENTEQASETTETRFYQAEVKPFVAAAPVKTETTKTEETEATTELTIETEAETEQQTETVPTESMTELITEAMQETEFSEELFPTELVNLAQPIAPSDTPSATPENNVSSDPVEEQSAPSELAVSNLNVSTISVSCLKVTWDCDKDCNVTVDTNAPYQENIYFYFKEKNLLYLTGLRENSEYYINVTPIAENGEAVRTESVLGHTEQVKVIYNFDEDEEAYNQYKDSGVLYDTNFFAGEPAYGLVAQPASGAIAGSINDPITDTGICRDEYGDYCAALGQFFGEDWDRYLVTFQNGQQITVKQCDSKGARWYHPVGYSGNSKNIVEFIWYGATAPSGVMYTGTWGTFIWNGMEFDHIQSIQKIEYPDETVDY